MELQIQDLVASIKSEGIENAKKEASRIIKEAQEKANSIVAQAKEEADKIYSENKKEIEVLKQSAIVSAQQAERDAIISFKQEIENQYTKILAQNIAKTMKDKALVKLIECVISDGDVSKMAVEVNEVSENLKDQLAEKIKQGLEIRPVKSVKAGFKVVMKDGSGFVDCTEDAIAQMLSPFFGHINL